MCPGPGGGPVQAQAQHRHFMMTHNVHLSVTIERQVIAVNFKLNNNYPVKYQFLKTFYQTFTEMWLIDGPI